MSKLISVIIPVYNSEKYVKECLESICANTHRELEIIVIDDGSKDQSGIICDELADKDARIRVIHQKNSGVSKSRNRGLLEASGKYITFVDSDDSVSNDYFEKMYYIMLQNPCDLVVCSNTYVTGEKKKCDYLGDLSISLESSNSLDKECFEKLCKQSYLYGPMNKLYKRELIETGKVSFPEDTSYGEDLLFNMRYLQLCRKVEYRDEPTYYYRCDVEGSLSHVYRKDLFENGVRLNDAIKKVCIEKNIFTLEMEKYWAARVFDDAYNGLFNLWNKQCEFGVVKKYLQTRKIMEHSDVIRACSIGDYSNYSKTYTTFIKRRQALLFSLVRLIKK